MVFMPMLFVFEICFFYILCLKVISVIFSIKFNKLTLYVLFIPIILIYICFALWALDTFLLMLFADLLHYKGFIIDRVGRININEFLEKIHALFFEKGN